MVSIIAFFLWFIPASFVCSSEDCKVLKDEISLFYEGDCKNGLAHGTGICYGADTYEGNFKKGLPHGEGVYTWMNGNTYVGEWKFGLRDGYGKMLFVEKDSLLEGYWKKDEYMGATPNGTEVAYIRNIQKVRFVKLEEEGHSVEIEFRRLGQNYRPADVIITPSSGIQTFHEAMPTQLLYYPIADIEFPFTCRADFKTLTLGTPGEIRGEGPTAQVNRSRSLSGNQVDCQVRFKIFEKGKWKVVVDLL